MQNFTAKHQLLDPDGNLYSRVQKLPCSSSDNIFLRQADRLSQGSNKMGWNAMLQSVPNPPHTNAEFCVCNRLPSLDCMKMDFGLCYFGLCYLFMVLTLVVGMGAQVGFQDVVFLLSCASFHATFLRKLW